MCEREGGGGGDSRSVLALCACEWKGRNWRQRCRRWTRNTLGKKLSKHRDPGHVPVRPVAKRRPDGNSCFSSPDPAARAMRSDVTTLPPAARTHVTSLRRCSEVRPQSTPLVLHTLGRVHQHDGGVANIIVVKSLFRRGSVSRF